MPNWLEIVLSAAIVLAPCVVIFYIIKAKQENEFRRKVNHVNVGMTKERIIELFGDHYTRSVTNGNVEILEWRHNSTHKVKIAFKSSRVIQVIANNN